MSASAASRVRLLLDREECRVEVEKYGMCQAGRAVRQEPLSRLEGRAMGRSRVVRLLLVDVFDVSNVFVLKGPIQETQRRGQEERLRHREHCGTEVKT